jgi:hypothetical protein
MKVIHVVIFCGLLVVAVGTGYAQTNDRIETLPIPMQAQIGNSIEIECHGPTPIQYAPASGSTKALSCGDRVLIIGGHGNSYVVRTDNGSVGYVPASVLPTEPCVQTRFRSAQLRKEWVPKIGTMSNDDYLKFKNELYLKVSPDDIAVAYRCLTRSKDTEESLGGLAGYANTLYPTFNITDQSTLGADARSRLMRITEALALQLEALNLLDDASSARVYAYSQKHDEVLDRYNALVDKQANLINFIGQRLHELDGAAPPASQADTSTFRQILAGTLQAFSAYTPPKHIVCDSGSTSTQYGDPLQPGYLYRTGAFATSTECQEK